jgi:hemoglobin
MTDIQQHDDVQQLVYSFYDRVQADTMLGPIFNDVAQTNWVTHLPAMVEFWSGLLLGTTNYRGRPFPKHAMLPIDKAHFSRWLNLFFENVDEQFVGPNAELAKARALSIATMFQHRLGLESGLIPLV